MGPSRDNPCLFFRLLLMYDASYALILHHYLDVNTER